MNNDNDLNLHLHHQMSGWLRYWQNAVMKASGLLKRHQPLLHWLIEGGGGEYSYLRVLPRRISFKINPKTTDLKRHSSGRTRSYDYPPPQLNALVSILKTYLCIFGRIA